MPTVLRSSCTSLMSYACCTATVHSHYPPFKLSSPSPSPSLASATSLMEEVWKDISVSPQENEYSLTTPSTLLHSYSNFHDFLARPSGRPLISCTAGLDSTFYPPPTTMLTLNSGLDIHFQHNPDALRVTSQFRSHPISNASFNGAQFKGFSSSSSSSFSAFSVFEKRRFRQPDGNSGERRHKRLIRNRESAARSRARKQAYTNELELEVAHLMEENARLKRQQDQVCLAASAARHQRKHAFQRSSTAPF